MRRILLENDLVRLAAEGEAIAAGPDELVFLRTEIRDPEVFTSQTLHLEGTWFLNQGNQLQFKTKISGEVFQLSGAWQVGRSNELIYTYQKTQLKRKSVYFQKLVFRGVWKLNSDFQLSYSLEGSEKALEFQGRLAKMVSRNGRAVIHYALGTRLRKSFTARGRDTLVLFGVWRPVSKLELGFEVQMPEGKSYLLKLKGGYRLTTRNEIEFQLSSGNGFQRPDLSVTLSRKILQGNGRLFLRGETDFAGKNFIGAGGQLKW